MTSVFKTPMFQPVVVERGSLMHIQYDVISVEDEAC